MSERADEVSLLLLAAAARAIQAQQFLADFMNLDKINEEIIPEVELVPTRIQNARIFPTFVNETELSSNTENTHDIDIDTHHSDTAHNSSQADSKVLSIDFGSLDFLKNVNEFYIVTNPKPKIDKDPQFILNGSTYVVIEKETLANTDPHPFEAFYSSGENKQSSEPALQSVVRATSPSGFNVLRFVTQGKKVLGTSDGSVAATEHFQEFPDELLPSKLRVQSVQVVTSKSEIVGKKASEISLESAKDIVNTTTSDSEKSAKPQPVTASNLGLKTPPLQVDSQIPSNSSTSHRKQSTVNSKMIASLRESIENNPFDVSNEIVLLTNPTNSSPRPILLLNDSTENTSLPDIEITSTGVTNLAHLNAILTGNKNGTFLNSRDLSQILQFTGASSAGHLLGSGSLDGISSLTSSNSGDNQSQIDERKQQIVVLSDSPERKSREFISIELSDIFPSNEVPEFNSFQVESFENENDDIADGIDSQEKFDDVFDSNEEIEVEFRPGSIPLIDQLSTSGGPPLDRTTFLRSLAQDDRAEFVDDRGNNSTATIMLLLLASLSQAIHSNFTGLLPTSQNLLLPSHIEHFSNILSHTKSILDQSGKIRSLPQIQPPLPIEAFHPNQNVEIGTIPKEIHNFDRDISTKRPINLQPESGTIGTPLVSSTPSPFVSGIGVTPRPFTPQEFIFSTVDRPVLLRNPLAGQLPLPVSPSLFVSSTPLPFLINSSTPRPVFTGSTPNSLLSILTPQGDVIHRQIVPNVLNPTIANVFPTTPNPFLHVTSTLRPITSPHSGIVHSVTTTPFLGAISTTIPPPLHQFVSTHRPNTTPNVLQLLPNRENVVTSQRTTDRVASTGESRGSIPKFLNRPVSHAQSGRLLSHSRHSTPSSITKSTSHQQPRGFISSSGHSRSRSKFLPPKSLKHTTFPTSTPGPLKISEVTLKGRKFPSSLRDLNSFDKGKPGCDVKSTPSCAAKGAKYCLQDGNYPRSSILAALSLTAPLVAVFRDSSLSSLREASLVSGLSRRQDEGFDYSYHNPGLYDVTHWLGGEGYVCPSAVSYSQPMRAENTRGEWRLIVQNLLGVQQPVRIEKCLYPSKPCRLVGRRYGSRCLQKFVLERLLVVDPCNPAHPPFLDTFRLPSACACHAQAYG